MRYADFRKICDRICDCMFAYNRHPWSISFHVCTIEERHQHLFSLWGCIAGIFWRGEVIQACNSRKRPLIGRRRALSLQQLSFFLALVSSVRSSRNIMLSSPTGQHCRPTQRLDMSVRYDWYWAYTEKTPHENIHQTRGFEVRGQTQTLPSFALLLLTANNNNNNNSNDNIYGAVIVVQSHCESSPGSCDEYGTAPSGRRPSDQAKRPGLWVRL